MSGSELILRQDDKSEDSEKGDPEAEVSSTLHK